MKLIDFLLLLYFIALDSSLRLLSDFSFELDPRIRQSAFQIFPYLALMIAVLHCSGL